MPDSKPTCAVIRGNDGRVLGLRYDEDQFLDRDAYASWDDFRLDFASVMFSRLPRDTESDGARHMIEKDQKRIELHHTT